MGNPNDQTDYLEGFVDNIVTVIQNYKDFLGLKNIFRTEDHFIPTYPSVSVELNLVNEEWKAMPRRKTIRAVFDITYYSSNLNDRNARQSLRTGLSKLSNCLRERWDINGYCPDLGSDILSVTPYVLAQGNEIVLGGVISLECRKVISVTLT